jgi:putative membrane protein
MLWIKALHVVFMVTWFAGLFYLPRLFVYHADTHDEISHQRFLVMERKLYIIMTIGAVLTTLFGIWMLYAYAWSAYQATVWLIAKLILVVLLIIFHLYCGRIVQEFRAGTARHTHIFYRWINEIPSVLLIGIVLLAVVKPF